MRVLYVNQTAQVSGAERSLLDILDNLGGAVDPFVACPPGQLADEIVARGSRFERKEIDRDEAITFFTDKGEKYKAQLIQDLPPTETITLYSQGDWVDLCRGPHMRTTADVGAAFKLMKTAGAYWRGDHRNAMLSRIYGTAWRDQKELDAYLHQLEEAERRDHRKIGKEMDLFHIQE